MQNASTLLGIIMQHAPDGRAQGLMAKKYYEITMQVMQDYEKDQYLQLERVMAGILSDGLSHGNWPWNMGTVCIDIDCAADHSVAARPK